MFHPNLAEGGSGTPYNVLAEDQPRFVGRAVTRDALMTFDARTVDSTGAFLIGELERLDQTLHEPLVTVTWGRDIQLREDVTIADESASFTNSTFASPGGITPSGKAWVGKETNMITGVGLDIGKTAQPLHLWAMEVKYTIPELESSIKLGRPVDTQKYEAMRLKHQMDIDEMVYVGDLQFAVPGLVNGTATGITTGNVALNAAGSSRLWANKTPDEILVDVNNLLAAVWAASGYAVVPTELRLPPQKFAQLVSAKVSTAGNISIIEFLRQNSITMTTNGRPLNILPLKWLVGSGAGGTLGVNDNHDRMIAYTNEKERVRYPMTLLQRTPLEYKSLWQVTTYYCRLGQVEFVYPETVGYADGF
jgi:hypothetical protein